MDVEAYDKIYPADYKLPRQLIHMQREKLKYFFILLNNYIHKEYY